MFPVTSLSVLEFSGHDAGQFLHNQLSADILRIKPGEAGFACCCNPAGRVIALLLISPIESSFYALCSTDLVNELSSWLKRFVFREKVTITIRTDLQVFSGDVDQPEDGALLLKSSAGLDYLLAVSPDPDEARAESAGQHWKVNELRHGVCWLDQGSSAKYLPQMLGFETIGALSFNKGCYPGQEIIARTRYLGKLKRRPVLVSTVAGIPVNVGDKAELLVGENSFSAVVVDSAAGNDGETTILMVARMGPETRPDRMRLGEQLTEIALHS